LSLFAPAFAFSQLDPYTVTVGVSRNLASQPDQVTLSIAVIADYNSGPDDVVAVLKDTGVTIANLSRLSNEVWYNYDSNGYTTTNRPVWTFNLPIPLGSLGSRITSLSNLANSVNAGKSGWQLSYSVQGIGAANPASCPIADLISDARGKALALANATGFGL